MSFAVTVTIRAVRGRSMVMATRPGLVMLWHLSLLT